MTVTPVTVRTLQPPWAMLRVRLGVRSCQSRCPGRVTVTVTVTAVALPVPRPTPTEIEVGICTGKKLLKLEVAGEISGATGSLPVSGLRVGALVSDRDRLTRTSASVPVLVLIPAAGFNSPARAKAVLVLIRGSWN
jgi:hypothetical protein